MYYFQVLCRIFVSSSSYIYILDDNVDWVRTDVDGVRIDDDIDGDGYGNVGAGDLVEGDNSEEEEDYSHHYDDDDDNNADDEENYDEADDDEDNLFFRMMPCFSCFCTPRK